jgi:hypothetical protein
MIIPGVLVALVGESVIGPVPLADTPPNVPNTFEVHENVVPATDDVGNRFSTSPLHIFTMKEVDGSVITGLGSTVTVTLIGVPWQAFASGVIS